MQDLDDGVFVQHNLEVRAIYFEADVLTSYLFVNILRMCLKIMMENNWWWKQFICSGLCYYWWMNSSKEPFENDSLFHTFVTRFGINTQFSLETWYLSSLGIPRRTIYWWRNETLQVNWLRFWWQKARQLSRRISRSGPSFQSGNIDDCWKTERRRRLQSSFFLSITRSPKVICNMFFDIITSISALLWQLKQALFT